MPSQEGGNGEHYNDVQEVSPSDARKFQRSSFPNVALQTVSKIILAKTMNSITKPVMNNKKGHLLQHKSKDK